MIVLQKTTRDYRGAIEFDVVSAIIGFQVSIDGIVQAELKRFQSRLHFLTPGQQRVIELSLREIGIKILDPVIRSLCGRPSKETGKGR